LQIFGYTKHASELIPANYELAREEFALSGDNYFTKKTIWFESKPTLEQSVKSINVTVNELVVQFDKSVKGLTNLIYKGKQMLVKSPEINFWRAPNDNDFGEKAHKKMNIWRSAGENIILKSLIVKEQDNTVTVNYNLFSKDAQCDINIIYTVFGDGSITCEVEYYTKNENLPELPRFGLLFTLPEQFENFNWYGRGPWENYVDRKKSSFVGIYKSKVKDQYTPYVRPQENGYKTDVRWLTLTDSAGFGLKVEGLQPICSSALNFRPEDFDPGMSKKQQHINDINPRREVVLAIDLFQRGIGGITSWGGRPLSEYRYFSKNYRYAFKLSVMK
jgi:beta-galactosidase